ncbi:MAG: AMP-binding protein, partial [Pirellulales bacterium]|nr:AMP-binding protein [Pirellulales bacterium]
MDVPLIDAFDGVARGEAPIAGVVTIAGDMPAGLPSCFDGADAMTFDQFSSRVPAGEEVLVDADAHDIACIMFTSGTTGPSKGVLMPHAHCYLFGLGTVQAIGLTDEDVYYVCMPIFHANGLLMQVLGSLIAGTEIYCVERFSPNRWLEDLRKSGATLTNALGVMSEFIYRSPPTDRDRENKLRKILAIPIGDWGADFEQRFGVEIMQGFGMTECNIPCYTKSGDPLVTGCAGHPLSEWFEVRVVDPENDDPMPPETVGEIVIRPKEAGAFMQGYFRMPEKTVEAWRNLWFHTGDAGRFDKEGRLFYVDRLKDCIRRRGENISSYEVEQVLNDHDAVAESAVVGIYVDGAGGEEEVKALI